VVTTVVVVDHALGCPCANIADATRALAGIDDIQDGSFTVVPFFPENFLVTC